MFIVILIILLVFLLLFIYSACKLFGDISREEEKYYEKIIEKE